MPNPAAVTGAGDDETAAAELVGTIPLASLYLSPKTLIEVVSRLASSSSFILPPLWAKTHQDAVDIVATLPSLSPDLAELVNVQIWLQSLPRI